MAKRIEHDFLGEKEIPQDVYYGIQTLRAIENFHITGIPLKVEPMFVQALGYVKKGAAMANRDLGVLDKNIAEYIIKASDRVIAGEFDDQFLSDLIQGGAGTSVNMNANEVIANVALEMMGKEKGQYEFCHPNNHVNCSQSTNDAYPTAFRIALINKLTGYKLTLGELGEAFQAKGEEFKNVLKMGRTQLQDAVPMSMGDEFKAFATNINEELSRVEDSKRLISEINMGATAIGTGVNAPKGYSDLVTKHLAAITGLDLVLAADLIEATVDTGAYVQLSGVLKRTAVKISKICNDLRLLSSGPRTGLNEINLPPMQPGSSIMPGKVNPVIPEVVNQTAFYVIGADLMVTMAAEAGQLQLNVMEPTIAFALFTAITYMNNACRALKDKCVAGITANADRTRDMVMQSIGIVTQLNPIIGYEKCSAIAREALETGKSVHDLAVKEKKWVTQEKWDEIFTFDNLIRPQFIQ
ncbi:aspartate ammonia-lyase [Chitinophaga ginsengisegetis]|uniref:Aspartate ammonia-lyase n=1 Tax=Chitinophaga ginsengisegetis TaxID=393003 RepID=A0A1T5NF49_9BACT|nr:aspartate ammonia-lyase [Chitinophaga ginsengisegetis]MDR6570475.1 aspartate ammonia-lyase [Chitinophaga ginsengisegetis]MDR6650209.1 aspartate ammonia-lyase [Chitinophaga ginsengisegetis]MDR6656672.1 aspartate ammonia-lyase [Chitinophaga ginsengisegetis]SKC98728.1 aspartate ammonia-lyase [Chitinophaga ginsengisegetis]